MRCGSVIVAINFIFICAQSMPYVDSSLTDLSVVSDGYDFVDYVPTHQNRPDGPWIVSTFPSSDYAEKPFRSTINVDYPALDISSANHHGNINHINNQFGSTFIPGIVDNSQLNSPPIRMLCVPNHTNNMKCIDAVSGPKPFNGYLKHTIRSGNVYYFLFFISYIIIPPRACMLSKLRLFKSIQIICLALLLALLSAPFFPIFFLFFSIFGALTLIRSCVQILFSLFFSVHGPFNSNVAARSPYSSISRPRRIYPIHVPVIKRPTIRDISNSAVKKIPFYMEKFSQPLHPSDKIMFSVYKKKRRIFQRSN